MRQSIIFILIVLLALPLGMASAQDEPACEAVLLLDLRARASVAPTSATYGTVVNLTDEDVTLSGGSTDAAEAVEIHTMTVDEEDVMSMSPLPDGLTIPPGEAVELAPGGLHVMIIGLTDFLEAETELDLTLNFADAGEASVSVPVLEIDSGMDMGDMEDEEMAEDIEDMSEEMGHQVSFEVLGECEGLESVWVSGDDAEAEDMEGMDMGESYELTLTLVFEDGYEVMHTVPVITAASLMEMEMGMDG